MQTEKRPRPEVEIDGVDLEDYRKLGTTLKPGEHKTLYSGHIVVNMGYGSCSLRILTPKTPEYEQMLEDFRNRH